MALRERRLLDLRDDLVGAGSSSSSMTGSSSSSCTTGITGSWKRREVMGRAGADWYEPERDERDRDLVDLDLRS